MRFLYLNQHAFRMIMLLTFLVISSAFLESQAQHTGNSVSSNAKHSGYPSTVVPKNLNNKVANCLPPEKCNFLNYFGNRKDYPFDEEYPRPCCSTRKQSSASSDPTVPGPFLREQKDNIPQTWQTNSSIIDTIGSRVRRASGTRRRISRSRNKPVYKLNPVGCGRRIHRQPHRRSLLIVGGQTVNQSHSWPWMAAIRMKTKPNVTRFLCGGTLITLRHVLTAAHCFGRQNRIRALSDYAVIMGSLHQRAEENYMNFSMMNDDGVTIATVSALDIHDGFRYPNNEHDIAVITLNAPVLSSPEVNPVCLPSGRTLRQDYGRVTVIGWGGVSFRGDDSEALQQATIKVVPISRCRRIFGKIPEYVESITNNVMCAGDMKEQIDACEGDSGGPLLFEEEEEERWIQLGIVAFGYRCAEKGIPGLYVRVASYLPWIRRIVERTK